MPAVRKKSRPSTEVVPDQLRASGLRQRIVDYARLHFLESGFRNITMDDIAGSMGISKKTLYLHFESKSRLLREVLLQKIDHFQGDMDGIIHGRKESFAAKMKKLLVCQQFHFSELKPPFLRDLQRDEPDAFQLVESRRSVAIPEFFGHLFNEGRRTGMIRKDIPLELMTRALLGAVQAIMKPEVLSTSSLPPDELFATVLRIIMEGVLTEKARRK